MKNISQHLLPKIQVNPENQNRRGTFATKNPDTQAEESIQLICENTKAYKVKAIFGDTYGIVAAVHGLGARSTVASPSPDAAGALVSFTGTGEENITPKMIEDTLGASPLLISGVIMESNSSASQLRNKLKWLYGDRTGNVASTKTEVAQFTTEHQYNEKTKVLTFSVPKPFSEFRAMMVDVNASETLTLTLLIAQTAGRV